MLKIRSRKMGEMVAGDENILGWEIGGENSKMGVLAV